MKPGVEPIRVPKARQIAPGPDQSLLDRVARELRVPKDEASGRVQPRKGRVDELGEGVMIAPLRASDELSLVHGRLDMSRPGRSCSTGYGVAVSQKVHSERREARRAPGSGAREVLEDPLRRQLPG